LSPLDYLLPMQLHSEGAHGVFWVPTLLDPVAERTCFSQADDAAEAAAREKMEAVVARETSRRERWEQPRTTLSFCKIDSNGSKISM
jgi:hypothetical protein